MLKTKDLESRFKTLGEYEQFALEWAETCYKINPTEQNEEAINRYRIAVETNRSITERMI